MPPDLRLLPLSAMALCSALSACRSASTGATSAARARSEIVRSATRTPTDAPRAEARHAVDALAAWPEMPEQQAPWVAAQSAPFERATQWLYEQGMPDPRGLEYVRARVTVGELWSGAGRAVEANGWRFRSSDSVQWFLGWNGNLYEPDAILAPADLAADIAALTDRGDAGANAQGAPTWGTMLRAQSGEAGSLAPSLIDPLTHAVLLRLGQRVDAEHAESALNEQTLVAAYAWALFDRAVCAHMRGDDLTTLRATTRLIALREAYAHRRASDATRDASADEPDGDATAFAAAASTLRADARRRLIRGARAASVVADPSGVRGDAGASLHAAIAAPTVTPDAGFTASPEARARAIIEELDDVDARQWGQPGAVNLASDRRVRALIALGEAAVPALIEALERDERLTRSVHFWRDFSRHRSVLGAHEAAYAALAAILQQNFFRTASTGDDLSARGPGGRAALVSRVREYWNRMRAMPLHQRAFTTLSDDRASLDEWATAAGNLVQTLRPDGSAGAMIGEPLRAQRGPTVSELLAQRIERALLTRGGAHEYPVDYLPRVAAARLTTALIAWEPASPLLRAATARWIASRSDEVSTPSIAALFDARDLAGDPSALDEYARWIEALSREDAQRAMREVLAVAARHPRDPRVLRATNAALSERGWLSATHDSMWSRQLFAATIVLPAMRAFVERRLQDRREIGTVRVQGAQYELRYRDEGAQVGGLHAASPIAGRWPWRACDELARSLVTSPADSDQMFGPPAQREAVIARVLSQLRARE